MEYYDSIDKTEFYEFYFTKSKKIYNNPLVIELLDGESLNDISEINLFGLNKNNTYESPVKRRMNFNDDIDYNEKARKMRTKTVSTMKVGYTNPEKESYG